MFRICRDHGFKQFVKKATREQHLLDLVISDLDDISSTSVLPRIADHNVVRTVARLAVHRAEPSQREVWLYSSADWPGLRVDLASTNWSFFDLMPVDDSSARFTSILLSTMRRHISIEFVSEHATQHPWLNNRCLALIQAKRDAEGTPTFQAAATLCSKGILDEHRRYISRLRQKLRQARRGSKHWWRLADQIAHRSGGPKGVL